MKQKTTHKILSLLLAVVLLFSLAPAVFAEGGGHITATEQTATEITQGQQYTLDLSQVFADSEGHTLSYAVTNDEGNQSTVNLKDGVYYFTSPVTGTYHPTITAQCESGSDSLTLDITVKAGEVTDVNQYDYNETDASQVTVYVTISSDGVPILGKDKDGTVLSHLKVTVPYFDLARYDLQNFYRYATENGSGSYTGDTVIERPTAMHLFIYMLERFYLGLPEDQWGTGESKRDLFGGPRKDEIENMFGEPAYEGKLCPLYYTGSATSTYMQNFWGHDENLMYYRNHRYPLMSPGWGATADYILLSDGDAIDLAMFSDWGFYHHGAFCCTGAADSTEPVETLTVTQGETLRFTGLKYGTQSVTDGGVDEFVRVSEDITYVCFDQNWDTTDSQPDMEMVNDEFTGGYVLDTADLEPGTYHLIGLDPNCETEDACYAPATCDVIVKESGHVDANDDGICDFCGETLVNITVTGNGAADTTAATKAPKNEKFSFTITPPDYTYYYTVTATAGGKEVNVDFDGYVYFIEAADVTGDLAINVEKALPEAGRVACQRYGYFGPEIAQSKEMWTTGDGSNGFSGSYIFYITPYAGYNYKVTICKGGETYVMEPSGTSMLSWQVDAKDKKTIIYIVERTEIPDYVWSTGVTLNETEITLQPNETFELSAIVTPENAGSNTVKYSTADINIASVVKTGVVTARAVGETTITATTADGKNTATCKVKVEWKTSECQHVDENDDGVCEACGETFNRAPRLKEGVKDVEANVVLNTAYLLSDLQRGNIFFDPDGDTLYVGGGGAGNAPSECGYCYQRSTDGGQTWSGEYTFASALFGATTISLTEKEPGTYTYRFYAKDGKGGNSADNGAYWYLTLHVDTAENLDFNTTFHVGRDANYTTNGNKMPVIKVYPSLGTDETTGYAIPDYDHPVALLNSDFAAAEDAANGYMDAAGQYNCFYATVKGGWYVYEGFGWNTETEAYDIPLGGMQLKIPADGNVDGNKGGGTELYLKTAIISTSSKKLDNTYFDLGEYTIGIQCPLMECWATPGQAYLTSSGSQSYQTLLYAGGNSCLFNTYLYPVDTENYNFSQTINRTLAVSYSTQGWSQTVAAVLPLTVTVPENAKFGLYFQYNNFNTSEQAPNVDWKTNGDGTKTAVYKVSKGNSNYTWRMTDTNGVYVTKAGWLPSQSAAGTMTLSFDGASTDRFSHDFSNLGTTTINRDEGDLQVNLAPSGAKTLTGTTRVRAYRWWELINSDTANIMIEPDEYWDVISGPATITYVDDDVTVTGSQVDSGNGYHNWADITANGGTSVIAVHYNALDVYNDIAASNHGSHGGFYPATNPDRVNFIIVSDATMGSTVAHVPYNSDGNGTQRSAEWDYAYDTWYYLRGDKNAALTFTTDNATKVEYAFATSDASFNYNVTDYNVVTAENGSYTVPLTAFDNAACNYGGTLIIRLTDANGAYSYQLVHVAGVTVNVVNKSSGESTNLPGDKLEVTFTGMYRSVNKMSGIFNPTTFNFRYTVDGQENASNLGQYMRADKVVMNVTVPANIDFNGGDTATLHFTNGYFYGSMYSAANPFSTIYEMTDTGVGTNFNAVTVSWSMQHFADFDVKVSKQPFNFRVNITDGENAVSGATLTLKKDGVDVAPNADGVYMSPFGTYNYDITCAGFMRTIGSFKFAMADADKAVDGVVTYDIVLNKATEKTWDGTTVTEPSMNADGYYEISNGAELAWFAQQVNAKTGTTYKAILTDDIDLGMQTWTPIGSSSSIQFKGTFDGNGHTIRNLFCEGEGNQGLFGSVGQGGLVKNFAVYGQVNSTKSGAAGVCGHTSSTATFEGLANFADVNVTGLAATAAANAGGIVGTGAATATIQNCYNAGSIYSCGVNEGGICGGTLATKIINCYNIGQVTSGSTSLTKCGSLAPVGTVTNSYFLNGTTNGTAVKGTAKTADEMKSADFAELLGEAFAADTAGINNGYPVLTWQIPATPAVTYGDVTGDGVVDSQDATLVYAFANGKQVPDATQMAAADVNGDGVVDSQDATLVYAFANGKLLAFPCTTKN